MCVICEKQLAYGDLLDQQGCNLKKRKEKRNSDNSHTSYLLRIEQHEKSAKPEPTTSEANLGLFGVIICTNIKPLRLFDCRWILHSQNLPEWISLESTSFVIDVLPNSRIVEHSQENNVLVYSVLNWSYAVRHYTSPGSAKQCITSPGRFTTL